MCPASFAPETAIKETAGTRLKQADGSEVAHIGGKRVTMATLVGPMTENFDVKEVSRPILAAGSTVDAGHGVWLHRDGCSIVHKDEVEAVVGAVGRASRALPLIRKRSVFVLPVTTGVAGEVCPVTAVKEMGDDDANDDEEIE